MCTVSRKRHLIHGFSNDLWDLVTGKSSLKTAAVLLPFSCVSTKWLGYDLRNLGSWKLETFIRQNNNNNFIFLIEV